MKKFGILLLSATLMLSSCQTPDQFSAATSGGLIGGIFGSAIGGLFGGPRGSDAGTLIGIIAGAAVGAAATAPEARDYSDYDYTSDNYSRRRDIEYSSHSREAEEMGREYANLEINNLRFVDRNNNKTIDANENCKLIFEIKNTGSQNIYDIAPVITVNGSKAIIVSPTAVISEIAPGKAVKYTAEVYAGKRLRTGTADFTISFVKGDYKYTMTNFTLATKGRK